MLIWLLAAALGAGGAGLEFSIGQHAALPGGTLRLPIKTSYSASAATAALVVNYDPQLLTLESISNGPAGGSFVLDYKIEEGRASLALVREDGVEVGDGILVHLNFRVNSGAVPGMSSPVAIADRSASKQYGEDLAWTGTLTHSNGMVLIVSSSTDTDVDGIPDWWEESFFGSPTGAVASADPDDDGLTTLQEYRAGTDPLDARSGLRIELLERRAEGVRVGFGTTHGRFYRVERSDNLLIWVSVGSEIEGTGARVEVVDPIGPSIHSRFYRLVSIR